MTHNPSTSNQFLGFDPSIEPEKEWSMEVDSWKFPEFGSQEEFVNFWGMDMGKAGTYTCRSLRNLIVV
jgi:hypothetical protein